MRPGGRARVSPSTPGAEEDEAVAQMRKCPLCGQPAALRYRPFCSKRCADLDLGRWLKGSYAIPGPEPEEDENGAAASEKNGSGNGQA